jgi:site-specific recombinase XerD
MKSSPTPLEQIFEAQIQALTLTLRPSTVVQYQSTVRCFLSYLRTAFPQVRRPSQLHRDPHLLGWFRSLCEKQPPLCNVTRIHHLIYLRRLLEDLAANGHSIQPDLIRREDFPPQPRYLPRPLSPHDDQLLQQELRRTDDLAANALLLTRATGMRIGECIDLPLDCLQQVGPEQWALHVPLGKLHNERLVPADPEIRRIVERILALRFLAPPSHLAKSHGTLLSRRGSHHAFYQTLRQVLAQTAQRAGCSGHVTLHQLRHSFATEMLQLGVSLPALMQLLGHKDIRMTLRYLLVTQQDLQCEFHRARQNATHPHCLPTLALPKDIPSADLPGIRQALEATRHLLEMYRRQLSDEKTRCKLRRLDKRLLGVVSQLQGIHTEEK